jgi:epoxyqueuosine reductase QueG
MCDEKSNYEHLEKLATDAGFTLFGVADISTIREKFHLDNKLVKTFNRGISLGVRLLDAVIDEIKDKPTTLYFHHYKQVNFFLDRGALLLAFEIQNRGYKSLPIPASQIIDWEKQQSHVSHKKVGYFAGLGWIGRNNLLVNPTVGSRYRLATLLTDFPLLLINRLKRIVPNAEDACPFVQLRR